MVNKSIVNFTLEHILLCYFIRFYSKNLNKYMNAHKM